MDSIERLRAHIEAIRAALPLNCVAYDHAQCALEDLEDLEIEIRHGLPVGVIAKARAALAEEAL